MSWLVEFPVKGAWPESSSRYFSFLRLWVQLHALGGVGFTFPTFHVLVCAWRCSRLSLARFRMAIAILAGIFSSALGSPLHRGLCPCTIGMAWWLSPMFSGRSCWWTCTQPSPPVGTPRPLRSPWEGSCRASASLPKQRPSSPAGVSPVPSCLLASESARLLRYHVMCSLSTRPQGSYIVSRLGGFLRDLLIISALLVVSSIRTTHTQGKLHKK